MDNNVVNTTQVGGSHYKHTTYQHWDFVYRALEGRYLEGNITKYLVRWRNKNGLQDLEKAKHYLEKLITEYNMGNVKPLFSAWREAIDAPSHFCDVNGVDYQTRYCILELSNWSDKGALLRCARNLEILIEEVKAGEPGAGYVDQG